VAKVEAVAEIVLRTEILAKFPKRDRGFLIPILQKVQEVEGYISPEAVDEISTFTGVSPGEIFGVASFYTDFRFRKPGRHTIRICRGTACHVRGSSSILDAMERQLKIKTGETTPDKMFSLEQAACFGCCALAPVVVVDRDVHGKMTSAKAQVLLKKYEV
jgi:NADH-quinone oxidoreductase subunit E